MKLSELIGVLTTELQAGDVDVLVAVRPGYGMIMPGTPSTTKRENNTVVLLADEVDLDPVDWVTRYHQ